MSLTCLPYKYYRFLWLSSWTSFAATSYGIYLGYPYDVYMVPCNIFVTSMIYWSYPVNYSWRYYLDVYLVKIHLLYALYRFYNSEYMIPTYFIWLLGVPGLYAMSLYYYQKKMYFESMICHVLVHCSGNLGNFLIFSGKVEDFCAPNSWTQKLLCG